MPDRMSEDLPDRMPDRMSEDMPDGMSEDMPDRMSEGMPDRRAGNAANMLVIVNDRVTTVLEQLQQLQWDTSRPDLALYGHHGTMTASKQLMLKLRLAMVAKFCWIHILVWGRGHIGWREGTIHACTLLHQRRGRRVRNCVWRRLQQCHFTLRNFCHGQRAKPCWSVSFTLKIC